MDDDSQDELNLGRASDQLWSYATEWFTACLADLYDGDFEVSLHFNFSITDDEQHFHDTLMLLGLQHMLFLTRQRELALDDLDEDSEREETWDIDIDLCECDFEDEDEDDDD